MSDTIWPTPGSQMPGASPDNKKVKNLLTGSRHSFYLTQAVEAERIQPGTITDSESCHSSQAAGEVCSAASSSDGAQLPLLKSTPTASESSARGAVTWPTPQTTYDGRTEEAWLAFKEESDRRRKAGLYGKGCGSPGLVDLQRAVTRSQYSATSATSTPSPAPATSSPADSPASRSVMPGSGSVRMTRATCGRQRPKSFDIREHHSVFSRTYRACSQQEAEMDAYAAGLIDGEGCISILCSKKRSVKYYGATVDVGMTKKALPILERMKEEYGGTIVKRRSKTHRWEEAWSWRMYGAEAVAFLQRVKPYLLMKKPQAETALALHAMIDMLPRNPNGTAKWSPEARLAASELKELMLRQNAKGPEMETVEGPEPFARLVDGVWVTPQPRLDGTSEPFSETWPKRGSMRNGACWEQTMSVPRIEGSGCGYWPTVQARDQHTYAKCKRGANSPGETPLTVAATEWDSARGQSTRQTWAAVTSRDHKDTGTMENGPENALLGRQVMNRTYQTPSQADAEGGHRCRGGSRADEPLLAGQAQAADQVQTGSLNPNWVAYLMGWPVGWEDASLESQWECPSASTDCEHLATVRCLNAWLQRSRTWLDRLE